MSGRKRERERGTERDREKECKDGMGCGGVGEEVMTTLYKAMTPGQLVMAAAEIPCGAFFLEVCAKTGDDIDSMLSITLYRTKY